MKASVMTTAVRPPRKSDVEGADSRARAVRWRLWIAAAAIWLSALAATVVFESWNWGAEDFTILAVFLFGGCACVEFVSRFNARRTYIAGFGLILLGMMIMAWINLAVGIIGSEDHPGNRMFLALPAIALMGALLSRFRPRGLAITASALAAGQLAIAIIAYLSGMAFIFPMTAAFMTIWMTSAWLFQKAAARVPRT
jgi:hypothetical protein